MAHYTKSKHKNTKVDPVFLLTYMEYNKYVFSESEDHVDFTKKGIQYENKMELSLNNILGIKTSIENAREHAKRGLLDELNELSELQGIVVIVTYRMKNRAYVASSTETWTLNDDFVPFKIGSV